MTVFDLLLDYVAYAGHSLKARDYGLILSSLVVDRQSKTFLAGRLLEAKQKWQRIQKGFQKYLTADRERSSFMERLSLPPVCGVTEIHRLEEMTRKVAETFEDAYEYVRRFSRKTWVLCCVDNDRLMAILWLEAWAVYQDSLSAKFSERFVEYARAELQVNQRHLQHMITYKRATIRTTPEQLARHERGYREGLIMRALGYEQNLGSSFSLPH